MGAVGFGYGSTASISIIGTSDPTVTVEKVQVGLSWPWLVVEAVTDRPS